MAGIAHGVLVEGAGDAQVYHQDRVALYHEVRWLDIAMDKRWVETAMQLGDGIAYAGEQPLGRIKRRPGFVEFVGKRATRHELHHHRILLTQRIAIDDARQVQEPSPLTLRCQHPPVRAAQPRFGFEHLAHVGALLGAVGPDEEHTLRALEAAFLQYRIDAIALIARKAVKMLLQGFFHNDDDGSRYASSPMPACRERDRNCDASQRRRLLGDGVFMEGVQLLVDGLQRFAMINAEDDDGIAAVLAIQLVAAARLQQAVRLAQRQLHGEGKLQ